MNKYYLYKFVSHLLNFRIHPVKWTTTSSTIMKLNWPAIQCIMGCCNSNYISYHNSKSHCLDKMTANSQSQCSKSELFLSASQFRAKAKQKKWLTTKLVLLCCPTNWCGPKTLKPTGNDICMILKNFKLHLGIHTKSKKVGGGGGGVKDSSQFPPRTLWLSHEKETHYCDHKVEVLDSR